MTALLLPMKSHKILGGSNDPSGHQLHYVTATLFKVKYSPLLFTFNEVVHGRKTKYSKSYPNHQYCPLPHTLYNSCVELDTPEIHSC